jgi:hypothetical protein
VIGTTCHQRPNINDAELSSWNLRLLMSDNNVDLKLATHLQHHREPAMKRTIVQGHYSSLFYQCIKHSQQNRFAARYAEWRCDVCSLDNRKAQAIRPKSVPVPPIRIPNRGPFHACSRQQKKTKTKSKTKAAQTEPHAHVVGAPGKLYPINAPLTDIPPTPPPILISRARQTQGDKEKRDSPTHLPFLLAPSLPSDI